MKKIIFFLSNLKGGGAERNIVNIANEIFLIGYNVEIWLCKKEGPYLEELNKDIKVVDFNKKRLIYAIPKYLSYLKKSKADYLMSTIIDANIISIIVKLLINKNIKLIIREANTINKKYINKKGKLLVFIAKMLYKYADLIIVNSYGSYSAIINELKINCKKVIVLNNAVINEEIFTLSQEKLDEKWINDKEAPLILSIGRLVKQKDYKTLIKAINIVRKVEIVNVIILGEGDQRIEIENMIKKYQLEDTIKLVGFQKNPYKYLKNADIFILSSKYEGFPNVLIQAMALNVKKIISSDCKSGPREVISSLKYGELFPVGDYNSLSKKIINALKNMDKPDTKPELKKYYSKEVADVFIREISGL